MLNLILMYTSIATRLNIGVITKGLFIVGIHFTSIADASHHNLCLYMINMRDGGMGIP